MMITIKYSSRGAQNSWLCCFFLASVQQINLTIKNDNNYLLLVKQINKFVPHLHLRTLDLNLLHKTSVFQVTDIHTQPSTICVRLNINSSHTQLRVTNTQDKSVVE